MLKEKKVVKKTSKGPTSLPDGYINILESITSKIKASQTRALTAVNRELIEVYREIGKTLYGQQEQAEWGSFVVERLAKDLQKTFPGMRGFSSRNLWRMKDFYLSYRENKKLTTLSAEISWSHNVALLSKCQDSLQREFYMRMSKKNGWTYRVLLHQIDNMTYEKTMTSQTSFDRSLSKKLRPEAKLAVKDEYAFGFLELGDECGNEDYPPADVMEINNIIYKRILSILSSLGIAD